VVVRRGYSRGGQGGKGEKVGRQGKREDKEDRDAGLEDWDRTIFVCGDLDVCYFAEGDECAVEEVVRCF
jgi:hypothetical protein